MTQASCRYEKACPDRDAKTLLGCCGVDLKLRFSPSGVGHEVDL